MRGMGTDPLDFLNEPNAQKPRQAQPLPTSGDWGMPKPPPRPASNVNSSLVGFAIAGGAILLIGGIVLVLNFIPGPAGGGSERRAQTASNGPALPITFSDFKTNNDLAFEQKYIGKLVQMSCGLNRVGRNEQGTPCVYLGRIGDYNHVTEIECRFAESDVDRLATISQDALLTIRGICRDQRGIIDNCTIVSVGKAPPEGPFRFGPGVY